MVMILADPYMGFFVLIDRRRWSHHGNPGPSDIGGFEIIESMLGPFKLSCSRSLDGYLLEVGETMPTGGCLPPQTAQLEPALLQPVNGLYN